jgi:hypothetical protein
MQACDEPLQAWNGSSSLATSHCKLAMSRYNVETVHPTLQWAVASSQWLFQACNGSLQGCNGPF